MVFLAVGCLGVLLAAAPGAAVGAGACPATPASGGPHALHVLHADAPPTGHTGGFGEPTCQACHTEYPLNIDGELKVDGFPERYAPGATYEVTLHLRSEGMERAGFQASVRVLEGPERGTAAGRLNPVSDRALVTEGEAVPYIQHAPGAAWTDGADTVSWIFGWTAPAAGGTVVLHVAANSANGDDSPFGDIVYTAERTGRAADEAGR